MATLALRRAILSHLKADAALTAVVAAVNIHPQQPLGEPSWPFIKLGAPIRAPREASCLNGDDVTFDIHVFTKERFSSGAIVETAEDFCHRATEAIEKSIHKARLTIADGWAVIRTTQTLILVDGATAGAFHGVVSCRAKVTR